MALTYFDEETGQFYDEAGKQALFAQRAAARPKFQDWISQNRGEGVVHDPNVDFDALLAAAVARGPFWQNVANQGGMLEVSTGPNQLWHLDPVGRKAYRSQEIQPGTPWGADPSNDFLSGKDGWRDAATIAAMAGAAYGGGALLGGGEAATGLGAVGDAAIAGGAGTDALAGGATLGSGLSTGSTATGIGGGATGTGLTLGTTASGVGSGATGTGLTAAGSAGGAFAPGYFAAESLYPVAGGLGAAGAAEIGGGSGASGLSALAPAGSVFGDLARGIPGVLGALASKDQSDSFRDLAEKYMSFGAPSRARFEGSFAPGFTMENDPGYKDALGLSTKEFLHKASIGGNPADSPNAWMQTLTDINSKFAFPALQEYRRLNSGAGGLATLTAAAPGADTSAINANRGVYDGIGAAAADIFTPRKSLADLLREARY